MRQIFLSKAALMPNQFRDQGLENGMVSRWLSFKAYAV